MSRKSSSCWASGSGETTTAEQTSEAAMEKVSSTLESRRLKNRARSNESGFLQQLPMVESQSGINNVVGPELPYFNSPSTWWQCVGVGSVFPAHFGPWTPINHCFNVTASLNSVADHVHQFIATLYHLKINTTVSSVTSPGTRCESIDNILRGDRT